MMAATARFGWVWNTGFRRESRAHAARVASSSREYQRRQSDGDAEVACRNGPKVDDLGQYGEVEYDRLRVGQGNGTPRDEAG
jgi:hypothetical protein